MGIWTNEQERERLRNAIISAWPVGPAPELRWLSEGFGSAAFESDDGLVALVAKNAIGAHSRRVTCALTPSLAPRVPVAIPQPVWSIEEALGLPFGAYAYPKLPGRPWTREEAASSKGAIPGLLARFLQGVHAYPVQRALDAGIPSFVDFWSDIISLRTSTDGAVRQRLLASEYAQVQAWWHAFLSDPVLQQGSRCLVHGDLWLDNVLVDVAGENLFGVIDFGDVAIIDASYDFVPLLESGPSLLKACLTTYSAYSAESGAIDASFRHRLRRWWELRSAGFFSLRASILEQDDEELQDSLEKLRRSPILTPTRLDKW